MTNQNTYQPGDLVRVTFGSKGTQKAKITQSLKIDKNGDEYYKGIKYVAKSERWTKNKIKIYSGEIIGLISRGAK